MTVSSEENHKDYPGLLLLMDLCVHPRQVEYERSTYDAVVASICASEMAEDRLPIAWFHYLGSDIQEPNVQDITSADGPVEDWADYLSGISTLSKKNIWRAWLRAVTVPLCTPLI